jgi:hypothetical protein
LDGEMKKSKKVRGNTPRQLTPDEIRDIKLWFGWGSILKYPTGPRDYLRSMLAADMRTRFLQQPRELRRLILRFVIDESNQRQAAT